jgi:cohesin loading factor subunit SCC2
MQGIKMSHRLQELLQYARGSTEPLRGVRMEDSNPTSLTSYVYSLIRGNRSQRRGLLTSILNMFDDTAVSQLLANAHLLQNFSKISRDEEFMIDSVDGFLPTYLQGVTPNTLSV